MLYVEYENNAIILNKAEITDIERTIIEITNPAIAIPLPL